MTQTQVTDRILMLENEPTMRAVVSYSILSSTLDRDAIIQDGQLHLVRHMDILNYRTYLPSHRDDGKHLASMRECLSSGTLRNFSGSVFPHHLINNALAIRDM